MIFLFSLINISFTFFFFLFWQYIESILFWALSILFVVYFSKIFSFFLEKENILLNNVTHKTKKYSLKSVIEFFKKWSYYISLLLFYLSLYWFIYSINLIYNFSNFTEIFHYITFSISLSITILFFSFLWKKYETLFRIFRLNCLIFTVIYSFFLLLFIIKHIQPNLFFIVNSVFPIITLWSVIIFDQFFKEKNKYIYLFFLFYVLLIGEYYISIIFSTVSLWYIFLVIGVFFMIIYTFLFPQIQYFKQFKYISQYVGIYMGYFISFSVIASFLLGSLSLFYSGILIVVTLFHYLMYKHYNNYISYIILLFTCVFLYIKIFFIGNISLSFFITFIFLLPYLFIWISHIFKFQSPKELYSIHFIGISFSIIYIIYYFIQIGFIDDILSLSIILFFESILLFFSYLRLKR